MLQQNIKQQWSFDIHNLYLYYGYCTFLSLFSVYRDPWTCVDIDDIHQPLMLAMAPPSDVATIRRGRLWEIGLEWLSGDSAVMWLATYELTLNTLLCPNTLLHILITRIINTNWKTHRIDWLLSDSCVTLDSQVRSLWDAHATEERGYLEREELESLLRHLHQAHKTLCTSTHINKKTSLSLTFKFEEFEEKGQCWTNQHSTFHVSVLTQGIVLRSVLIQP